MARIKPMAAFSPESPFFRCQRRSACALRLILDFVFWMVWADKSISPF